MLLRLLILFIGINSLLSAQDLPVVYPFANGKKWGIVDGERREILSPELDSIAQFYDLSQEGANAIAWEGDRCGILNREGEWIVKPKLDSIGWRHYRFDSLRWVQHKGRLGVLKVYEGKAKWQAKPRYNTGSSFEGCTVALAAVSRKGRWGVIDGNGQEIVKCKYDTAVVFATWRAVPFIKIQQGESSIYLDANGNLSEEAEQYYEDEEIFFEDTAIEAPYESAPLPSPRIDQQSQADGSSLLILKADLNFTGYQEQVRVRIPAGFEIVESPLLSTPEAFQYIKLRKDGKYGFMDNNSQLCTPVKYDEISTHSFSRYDKVFLLHLSDKIGLADWRGQQILPAVFERIERRYDRMLWVTHPSGYKGYATYKGDVFLPSSVNLEEQ